MGNPCFPEHLVHKFQIADRISGCQVGGDLMIGSRAFEIGGEYGSWRVCFPQSLEGVAWVHSVESEAVWPEGGSPFLTT